MKGYDKERLHEYAKELFALCLEKNLNFECIRYSGEIKVVGVGNCYICDNLFNKNTLINIPIWELIEKVKQL